jgi:hypothetical protein
MMEEHKHVRRDPPARGLNALCRVNVRYRIDTCLPKAPLLWST